MVELRRGNFRDRPRFGDSGKYLASALCDRVWNVDPDICLNFDVLSFLDWGIGCS